MKRGEIYWAQLDPVVGHEQGGGRPVLVVQNDNGNRASRLTIIAPITTRPYRPFPFLVRVPEGVLARDSTVDCAQLRTVDKSRLGSRRLATLDELTMARVDAALRVSLELDE